MVDRRQILSREACVLLGLLGLACCQAVGATRSLTAASCAYGGGWIQHGEWFEGQTSKCLCWNGGWRDCAPLSREPKGCPKQQYPPKAGCNFVCPDKSCVKEGRDCVDTFDDCECDDGFVRLESGSHPNRCIPKPIDNEYGCKRQNWPPVEHCEFVCPEYSCAKEDRLCIDSINDCDCGPGARMRDGRCDRDEDYCMKEHWPPTPGCSYKCPDHACMKPGRDCLNDFNDCECEKGFKAIGNTCFPDDYCIKEQWPPKRGCSYRCPENSCVKTERDCVDSIDDCECDSGFKKQGDKCVKPPSGPQGCTWQGRQYWHWQWRDDSCQCKDGGWRCQTKGCFWSGIGYNHGQWKDDQCQCSDGTWECQQAVPTVCYWSGTAYSDGEWKDQCRCADGRWDCVRQPLPAPPPPPPAPRGCFYEDILLPHGTAKPGSNGRCTCDNGSWDCDLSCWWEGVQFQDGWFNRQGCRCGAGDWDCGTCAWGGATYQNAEWRDSLCQCVGSTGQWTCKEPEPRGCQWGNTNYNDGDWKDSACMCQEGSWTCNQGQQDNNNQNGQQGCIGGLPFGLENCVCDGADVGTAAGAAACSQVKTRCDPSFGLQPFLSSGLLEAVQKICDTLALDACIGSAQNAISQDPVCQNLLENGSPSWNSPRLCTASQARSIFMENVQRTCDPICPGCVRLP